MSAPTRKPAIVAEATQELQVADAVSVVARLPREGGDFRKSLTSLSSIAPVGLDVVDGSDALVDDDAVEPELVVARAGRRRVLGGIVVGAAVSACAVILVAAAIAWIGRQSQESEASPSTPRPTAETALAAALPARATPTAAPEASPASAGTLRLEHPAKVGYVWVDGTKVSTTSVAISCGTHQIKVGRGRKHSVEVPCGGEVAVSR